MIGRRHFLGGACAAGAAAVVAACSAGANKGRSSTVGAPASSPPAPSASGVPTTTPAPTTTRLSGPATFVTHGPATSTAVALTFHTAGDPAITEDILVDAARLGAKLTFFVVGTWAQANPGTLKRIIDGGHELGNHTWSHINLPQLGPDAMLSEITRCAEILTQLSGSATRWFRPSQTDVPSAAILTQAGRAGYATSVGYDVDPLDFTNPGAGLVLSRTRAALHPGAIVSLHTLYRGTATAFPQIVAAIRGRNFEPGTVSAVLGH
ncbi:MAG: polysaccharide deacetylase family protein [Acidimicrobiales bacterium]